MHMTVQFQERDEMKEQRVTTRETIHMHIHIHVHIRIDIHMRTLVFSSGGGKRGVGFQTDSGHEWFSAQSKGKEQ